MPHNCEAKVLSQTEECGVHLFQLHGLCCWLNLHQMSKTSPFHYHLHKTQTLQVCETCASRIWLNIKSESCNKNLSGGCKRWLGLRATLNQALFYEFRRSKTWQRGKEMFWVKVFTRSVSPGDFHERYRHGGGVDGQISVQIDDDADVEHVDSDWNTERMS